MGRETVEDHVREFVGRPRSDAHHFLVYRSALIRWTQCNCKGAWDKVFPSAWEGREIIPV